MKTLKTYEQLFEKNNEVRYISGGESVCPVCGEDDYYDDVDGENLIFCCETCDYKWKQHREYVYSYGETPSLLQEIIHGMFIDYDEESQQKEITKIKQWNKELKYLSDGEENCPFCGEIHDNLNIDYLSHEQTNFLCERCDSSWRIFYDAEIISITDKNDKKIIVGDIVDEKLFDQEKYDKFIKNKKIKEFNL